ncbi:MAG: hypothetical protein ABEK36_04380 [Candidatus Aenigmatarchaeota archaeon]
MISVEVERRSYNRVIKKLKELDKSAIMSTRFMTKEMAMYMKKRARIRLKSHVKSGRLRDSIAAFPMLKQKGRTYWKVFCFDPKALFLERGVKKITGYHFVPADGYGDYGEGFMAEGGTHPGIPRTSFWSLALADTIKKFKEEAKEIAKKTMR